MIVVRDGEREIGRIYAAGDLLEQALAEMPVHAKISNLHADLGAAWDTPRRWAIIRAYYGIRRERIAAGDRICPYELGLERFLTPIEAQLWQDIRGMGLPFYMQYPVGKRFVDFGDPVQQIAIEADGAAYHTPEKDAQKTAELQALGWMVFRIKGRDTFGEVGTKKIGEIARWYGRYEHEQGE